MKIKLTRRAAIPRRMARVPSENEWHVSGSDFCGDLDDESRYYDSPGRRSQSSQHSMASGFEAVT